MDENYSGIWWSPENTSRKIHGSLKYTDQNGLRLETEEYDADLRILTTRELDKKEIIFGKTSNGQLITLQGCTEINSSSNLTSRSKRTLFYVKRAFLDVHTTNVNSLKFQRVKIRFTNLDEWVNIHGFDFRNKKKNVLFSIKYKLPRTKKVRIFSDMSVKIVFEVGGPERSIVQKNVHIDQKTFLELTFKRPKKLMEIQNIIKKLQDFLTLATQVASYPTNIVFYEKSKKTIPPKSIEMISSLEIREGTNKPLNLDRMLFSYHDIHSNFKSVISNWFSTNKEFQTSVQSYFSIIYNQRTYLEHHFLGYVGAIEDYHRIKLNGKYVDDATWKKVYGILIKSVPANLNKDFSNNLKSKMFYMNEYSLMSRLGEIVSFLGILKINKKYIQKSVITRNFLTHHDKKLGKKSFHDQALYEASLLFKMVFELCLLKELGFDPRKSSEIMKNRYSGYRFAGVIK